MRVLEGEAQVSIMSIYHTLRLTYEPKRKPNAYAQANKTKFNLRKNTKKVQKIYVQKKMRIKRCEKKRRKTRREK